MEIDYNKIDYMGLGDSGAEICKVENFEFVYKDKVRAYIQVLDFGNGKYASQARFHADVNTKWGSMSSCQEFETAEEAINDILKLVIGELISDPHFREETIDF